MIAPNTRSACRKAGNLQGREVDGGNVFEAPRHREYPLPALQVDQSGANMEEAARKLGYHPFLTPRAILSEASNGRPACTYCGFCQAFGCHVGAKSSDPYYQAAGGRPHRQFQADYGWMCYRVNSDNSGRATGVAYFGPDGSDNTIEAEIVILAPFIYDNVRLLLLSKTEKFPNGLANSSGQVGKHLMAHIGARALRRSTTATSTSTWDRARRSTRLDDFNADNFDHGGLGFIRGAQIFIRPRRT